MPKAPAIQKYVVCNSDESEPGTCSDRDILRFNPHAVVEGMAIAAMRWREGRLQLHARRVLDEPVPRFEAALRRPTRPACSARTCSARAWTSTCIAYIGAGAYICGEETALLESLEGKQGKPRFKPPFPANKGLYGQPTTINNTQTFASVPAILRNGAQWFMDLGVKRARAAPRSSRCRATSTSRAISRFLWGFPFRDLLALAGGVWKGRKLKAVIPGGSSAPVLPRGDDGGEHGLRVHQEGRLDARLRRGHGDGRDDLHGAGAGADQPLLLRGILRPVHALPRGHRLDEPGAQAHPEPDRAGAKTSTCSTASRGASRAIPSAPSAMRRRGRCRVSSGISATSSST
jgi:hypothetical protein